MVGYDLEIHRRHFEKPAVPKPAEQPQGPLKIGQTAAEAQIAMLQILAYQIGRRKSVELLEARFQTRSFCAFGTGHRWYSRPSYGSLCYVLYANVQSILTNFDAVFRSTAPISMLKCFI